jgi:hypothetical protein
MKINDCKTIPKPALIFYTETVSLKFKFFIDEHKTYQTVRISINFSYDLNQHLVQNTDEGNNAH